MIITLWSQINLSKVKFFSGDEVSILDVNIRSMKKKFESARDLHDALELRFSITCFSEL